VLTALARAFAVADSADPESFLLYENEAICRRERWRLVEDPVDRDKAIDAFARMMSDERTTWRYDAQLGDLLRQRGAERADLADLEQSGRHSH